MRRCLSASVKGGFWPVMRSGEAASICTLTTCGAPDRLVTSSAIVALSPGAMKRGIDSSATSGAATIISVSALAKLSAVLATAIRRSVPLKSGSASWMVASPLASSATGPLNRSTRRTLRGMLWVSRRDASPPKRCLATVPSIVSISLPYRSSRSAP